MSSAQKIVVVTILKIFNWSQADNSNIFEITFSSLKTSTKILQKQLKCKVTSVQVIFDYSLKVTYTSDENEIVVRLSHLQQSDNTFYLMTEFTLNLDHLASKKVQFFPFGDNDKVIKIISGQGRNQPLANQLPPSRFNYQFIRQKQDFLRRISTAASDSRLIDKQQKNHPSLSKQTKDLLFQVRSVRNNKPLNNNDRIQKQFDYYHKYEQGQDKVVEQSIFNRKIISKSSSQQSLGMGSFQPLFSGEGYFSRQSHVSQKHKLKIKSLEMVPTDNEYYEDYCQPQPLQKRTFKASQYRNKIFRSKFY